MKVLDEEGVTSGAGHELARTDRKGGRARSRTPFEILRDHHRHGRARDWRLWMEWILTSRGRRTLEWSRGLRARLRPGDRERTDEELAEESEPALEVAALEADVWLEVVRRGLSVAVLEAVEAQGLGGLIVLLRAGGVPVEVTNRGPGPPGWWRRGTRSSGHSYGCPVPPVSWEPGRRNAR